jgi:hypothetical protein
MLTAEQQMERPCTESQWWAGVLVWAFYRSLVFLALLTSILWWME